MAAKPNLEKMTLDELKSLKKDVDKAIDAVQRRQRTEALKEMQAVAKKHGLSVDEVIGSKPKAPKSKAPAKYRNPENPDQVWSGRGRQPTWYKAAVEAGKKPESMEI